MQEEKRRIERPAVLCRPFLFSPEKEIALPSLYTSILKDLPQRTMIC
jgi:hypothetical protein